MIKIKYYATERDDLKTQLSYSDDGTPISIKPLSEVSDKIKTSAPIFNFANFFGQGIDLYDETIELGEENDYYGFIPQKSEAAQSLTIEFEAVDGEEPPKLDNGITIEFHKHTCKKITVERNGVALGTAEDENGLPEKVHIVFQTAEDNWSDIVITFSGMVDSAPINLKGVVLGKIIDIDNIMAFDMIAETNPISDDLALNETNVTAIVDEDFTEYEEQKIVLFDNDNILESDYLSKTSAIDENVYDIKSRSVFSVLGKTPVQYNFDAVSSMGWDSIEDWVNYNRKFSDAINKDLKGVASVEYPAEIADVMLSPFLAKDNARKVLQQIAWASCCGLDTTYSEKIKFIPFFASETTAPDIVISNADDRILKTAITMGEQYSKIIWEKVKHSLNAKEESFETLATFGVLGSEIQKNNSVLVEFKEPCIPIEEFSVPDWKIVASSPYSCQLEYQFSPDVPFYPNEDYGGVINGYRYSQYSESTEIKVSEKGDTLEITDQLLYPIDDTKKIAQLKKWYSRNNTLSATVVDNDSEIRVGKIVKIQLKNGKYFQGIVTSVVRNNVGTYHTVELEAHEWN